MRPDLPDDRSPARVAVGRFVLELGEPGGVVVREAARSAHPHFRPRATPVLLRPRSIRGLLGRQTELAAAVSAIGTGVPVEVSGEPGIGKTAILRHLGHHPPASCVDGTVYIAARHESPLDLRKRIFDAFHESDAPCQPTDVEIRRGLHDKHALILLDDVRLTRQEVEELFDVAPRCAFVVATRERCLLGDVRSVALSGLPVEDATALLERELERALEATEHPAAADMCAALEGHPLRIRHAAALIRDRGILFDRWRDHVTADNLIAELLTAVDERPRRVLLTLAALPTVSLHLRDVSGIAELTDVESVLTALARTHLVASHGWRYHLVDGVADRLRRSGDLKPSINRAITYFTAWADRHRRNHEQLLEASDALMRVQEHAIDERRWGEALRLGKQLERPLVTGGRWGAWEPVLERSLTAAKALGDRSVEAWALHQLGTRAVCLDDAGTARRVLGQAASLRDELGETGAAAVSRRNLGFVVTTVLSEKRRERETRPFDDIGAGDLPLLHDVVGTTRTRSRVGEVGALLITFLMCAALGGFTYAIIQEYDPEQPVAPAAAATPVRLPSSGDAPAAAPVAQTASDARRANILIFTARPGSIVTKRPTDLCYAVSGALRTRIEPAIGDVEAMDALTCRRVAPVRTTTYELTAVGGDGIPVSQQVVIVVR
jgi:NB-ARC domain